jgi:hypothetical protein
MYFFVAFVAGAMLGFLIGMFIFRNNAAKAELEIAWIKEELRKAKGKVGG